DRWKCPGLQSQRRSWPTRFRLPTGLRIKVYYAAVRSRRHPGTMTVTMDRVIEKQSRPASRWMLIGVGALAVVLVAWQVVSRAGSSRLRVDAARITTAVVQKGVFREYYPFDGTVEPATTHYLDVEQGGRVERIHVEGGQQVKQGDLLVTFANVQAQRNAIETETRL